MTQAKIFEQDEKEYFDEEEEDLHIARKPGEAPDGGWGWMVVLGTFICCLFVNGIQFSYKELTMEISEHLHVPQESVISVGHLMASFSFIGGPFTYMLVKRFGCSKVVIAGSTLTFLALIASSRILNLDALYITYGVLAGFGCSLVYLPSIIIVTSWFHHRRAFATGLAVTGAGAGVLIFPPLFRHLLDVHSWRNTVLIISALFLHCAAAGALFRPIIHAKQKTKMCVIQRGTIMQALIAEKERQRTISNGSLDNCIITKENKLIKIDRIDFKNKTNSYLNIIKESLGFSSRSLYKCRSKSSLVVPKVFADSNKSMPSPPIKLNSLHIKTDKLLSSTTPTPKRDSGVGNLQGSPKSKSCEALPTEESLVVSLPPKQWAASVSACYVNNIDDFNTLDNVSELSSNPATPKMHRHNNVERSRTISNSSMYSKAPSVSVPMEDCTLSIPNFQSNFEENVITDFKLCRQINKWLDLKILKSLTFLLLSLSSMCTIIGIIIPQVHVPQKGMLLGITVENSNFVILIFWVVHTIGRLTMGWIADRPWASAVQLNNIMILVAGVVSCFSIKYTSENLLYLYAVIYGFSTASFFTLQSIITIELFGKERLQCALGFVSFFQGVAMLVGFKFSDLLHGFTDSAISIAGVMMIAGALLGFPLRKVQQWEKEKSDNALQIIQIEEIHNGSEMEMLKVENWESTI